MKALLQRGLRAGPREKAGRTHWWGWLERRLTGEGGWARLLQSAGLRRKLGLARVLETKGL